MSTSPPIVYAIGLWSARGMSIVGSGATPEAAWADAALPPRVRRQATLHEVRGSEWDTDPRILRMRRGE